MNKRHLIISLLYVLCTGLSGCARGIISEESISLRWVVLSHEDLQVQCGGGATAAGCYRRSGDHCNVYTFEGDPELNDTLGHEVRHCFKGAWHCPC